MQIGILQCGDLPDEIKARHGDYPDLYGALLAPHGMTVRTWRVVDGVLPDGPEDADGWLISGSRHGAYEDHAWIPPLEAFIRDCLDARRPLVGVCFGHQIVAQALGGKVEKFAGGWSVGPTEYDFGSVSRRLIAWHQDQVVAAPEGAITVAATPSCAHAALIYPGRAYTVQPHPEFTAGFTADLMAARGRGVVPDAILDVAAANLDKPLDNAVLGEQFARFFREGAVA